MCGRYSQTKPPEVLRLAFQCVGAPNFPPAYNAAPSQHLPVVVMGADGQRHLVLMRWGLVPVWSKDGKPEYNTINAKAETVDTKPTYRDAFRKRRCLVPVEREATVPVHDGGRRKVSLGRSLIVSRSSSAMPTRWSPRCTIGCR